MALIRVQDGCFSFATRQLFENLNFAVNVGDRIGLVGDNGCGKSTLVRIILGEYELDRGVFTRQSNLIVGYMPQSFPDDLLHLSPHEFLRQAIDEEERAWSDWKVDVSLQDIGLNPDLWHSPLQNLSGGWRRLILILRAQVIEPDLLVLDEPTNHLDLGKIVQLERWLVEKVKNTVLLISHDREFLDSCTEKTLFLRSDGMFSFDASFSTAREALINMDISAQRQRANEEKAIRRLERAAKRLRVWSTIGKPNPDLARKAKIIERRADKIRSAQTSIYQERRRDIALSRQVSKSSTMIRIEKLVLRTPDGRALLKTDHLYINKGEKVALLGANGLGKTQLVQRLIRAYKGETALHDKEGSIVFNPQVQLGIMGQHLEDLPIVVSPYKLLEDTTSLNASEIASQLHNIGFLYDEQTKTIKKLSFGERARLVFLLLKLRKPNFYIFDEPTNHIDISGQEQLEDLLDDDAYSCILISHDRRLLRNVPNRYVWIKNRTIEEVEDPEQFFEDMAIPSE